MNVERNLYHNSTFSISQEARRLHDLVDSGTHVNDDTRIGSITEKDQIRKNMIHNIDRMLQSDRISINELRSADAMLENYVSETFLKLEQKNGLTHTQEYEFGCEDTKVKRSSKRKPMPFDL
jgi:hypothetical protein